MRVSYIWKTRRHPGQDPDPPLIGEGRGFVRGVTQAEIADCFGVNTRTFYHWLARYPELKEAVDSGVIDSFNPRVERALAERAIGYSVDEEQCFVIDGKVHKETVRKQYPPNVTAGIYFSKNRMPDRWRDVHRHEVKDITPLKSSDELRQMLMDEFKDYIEQGLLQLPAPNPKLTTNKSE